MKVFIERKNKRMEIEFSGTARELLEKIGVDPEDAIILKGKTPITPDDEVTGDDELTLLAVISGG